MLEIFAWGLADRAFTREKLRIMAPCRKRPDSSRPHDSGGDIRRQVRPLRLL
jgi:hypothetical protein